MTPLPFRPIVFRIKTDSVSGNQLTWNLLTLDGESPNETVYFMLNGNAPSFNDSDLLNKSIESEEWEAGTLDSFGRELSDFQIDAKIFETAGEGYAIIRQHLSNL